MRVKVVKNPGVYTVTKEGKRVPYGWVVFPVVKYCGYNELDECPLQAYSNPFKTKKNAINAVKNGRFEKDGVIGISYAKKVYPHTESPYWDDFNC